MSTYEIVETVIAMTPTQFKFGPSTAPKTATSVWVQPDGADPLKAAAFGEVGAAVAKLKPGTRARMVIKFDTRVSVIDGRKIEEDRAMIDSFEVLKK